MRVISLSWAIASAMALVRSVSAAWMRRCFRPWPNEHQAIGIQARGTGIAGLGGLDDRPGARPKADLMGEIAEPLDFFR